MSRSCRHTPIVGNCGGSDKFGKVFAHRKLRRLLRVLDPEAVEPTLRDVSDPWRWSKDGKRYVAVPVRSLMVK